MRVLEAPDQTTSNGILVASARDIAGTKAKATQRRVECRAYQDYQDYQDIRVLLGEFSLAETVDTCNLASHPVVMAYTASADVYSIGETSPDLHR